MLRSNLIETRLNKVGEKFKMEYRIVKRDDSLQHHGIKGMKWGERRWQYKDGSLTPEGYIHYGYGKNTKTTSGGRSSKKKTIVKKKSSEKEKMNVEKTDIEPENNNKVSLKDSIKSIDAKKVAAVAVAGYMVTKKTMKMKDAGDFVRLATKGKRLLRKQKTFKKNMDLAKPDLSIDDISDKVVSRINPDFGKPGTTMNCKRCTFAYELSRRGYDVKATTSKKATGQTGIGTYSALTNKKQNMFTLFRDSAMKSDKESYRLAKKISESQGFLGTDDVEFPNITDIVRDGEYLETLPDGEIVERYGKLKSQSIQDHIVKHGERARGEISVLWAAGGGHSMAWEVIDGKPVIFDCQTGDVYKTESDFERLAKVVSTAVTTRLDNVEELNEDFLLRWVEDAA